MSRPRTQKSFGRFKVTRILGRGGMGTVYEAVDPVIQRQVAIKEIRADPGVSEAEAKETRARFELEFRAAGTLSHPNIVTIYDVGQGAGLYFIAMEKVEGRSLAEILSSADPQPIEWSLSIAEQIARGLDHAHAKGIIHRDVKPGNVLVTEDDHAKLTDFGLVKTMASEITTTGTLMGTPAFMSPEQVQGKSLDGRSDQFSLAVICFQMLTGKQPFRADQPAAILYRIVHEEPTPPGRLRPELPAAVDRVILQALAKGPEERFGSCVEFVSALRRAMNEIESTVRPRSEDPDTLFLRPDLDDPPSPSRSSGISMPSRPPQSHYAQRAEPSSWKFWLGIVLIAVVGLAGGFYLQTARPVSIAPGEQAATEVPSPEDSEEASVSTSPEIAAGIQHEIQVSGVTEGGSILRDGEDTGLTVPAPVTLQGAPGAEVALQVLGPGGEALASRTFTLGDDLPSDWQPFPGFALEVRTMPSGATIRKSDETLGKAPLSISVDGPEAFRLEARLDGHHSAQLDVDPAELLTRPVDERTVTLELRRRPPPGTIAVKASYPVRISSGRSSKGPAQSVELRLAPGRHEIELFAPDVFLRQTRTVDVESGGTQTISLPAAHRGRIRTHPERCKISIDGIDAGFAPFIGEIATGVHTLRLEWPAEGRTHQVELTVQGPFNPFFPLDDLPPKP